MAPEPHLLMLLYMVVPYLCAHGGTKWTYWLGAEGENTKLGGTVRALERREWGC